MRSPATSDTFTTHHTRFILAVDITSLTVLPTWFPGCCWRCVAGSWWSQRSWTRSSWRRKGRRRWRRRLKRTRWGICRCRRHCGSLTCWWESPRYCRSGCLLGWWKEFDFLKWVGKAFFWLDVFRHSHPCQCLALKRGQNFSMGERVCTSSVQVCVAGSVAGAEAGWAGVTVLGLGRANGQAANLTVCTVHHLHELTTP